jgi:hypothetical protein
LGISRTLFLDSPLARAAQTCRSNANDRGDPLYNRSGSRRAYHVEVSDNRTRGELNVTVDESQAIQVEEYFEQQVEHESDETPLRPV